MRICWDNLEKLRFNERTGKWYHKNTTYVYVDSCDICGEPYLMNAHRKTIYCDKSCSHQNQEISLEQRKILSEFARKRTGDKNPFYGKSHSEEIKKKISNSMIGKYISKEHPNWDGGYNSNNIPKYNTYAHQISFAEEVRRDPKDKNILQVKCSKCKKWHIPKRSDVRNRIKSLNSYDGSEHHFYCSSKCKQECPIYRKINYQVGHPKLDTERPYQREWSKMVKERDEYQCVICGSKENLHAHHIDPVKTHPHLQADVDNGITLCEKCHNERGHMGECSTGNLASLNCY